MRFFYLLSVWLHILAAATWLGGMLFLALVVVPSLRRPEYQSMAAPFVHRLGVRFRWLGWLCLGLLILSGTFNLIYRGYGWDDLWSGRLWQGPFGQALGIKLFLVAVILVLSAMHDFRIGPRATALWQANPASPEAKRWRRQASWIGRLNLILALVVVALAVILVRGWP
jgi:putative copper resistance protein D